MFKKNSFRTRREFLRSSAGVALTMPVFFEAVTGQARDVSWPRKDLSPLFAAGSAPLDSAESAIEFDSSDAKLVQGFQWAKSQALAYVRNGDPIGAWYEAALPGRNAFCMRDVSHMSTGAQFLGLGRRTKNMLRHFVDHISAAKNWCTWWEITREDKPAPVDYNNDHDFWYDLPASFDVVDACYRQWLWSRDNGYLDEVFLNYYHHTVTDYVEAWDHNHDGLLEHLPQYGHMGIATYDEDLSNEVLVGADLIAAQYAAYRCYGAIQRARNEPGDSTQFEAKADSLKSLYNGKWWDASRNSFYAALGEDRQFHRNLKASTGGSDIEFPLYFQLTDAGFKTQASLDELNRRLQLDEAAINGVVGGVEGRTYLPDIFYKYGRSQSGYTALIAMMNPSLKRREYPEVSYTVVGNLGAGLMGLRPLARDGMIETYPQLTVETKWAALSHVPVGKNVLSIRHTENRETTLTNETGPAISWRASFPGKADILVIGGRKVTAQNAVRLGGASETYDVLEIGPGETRGVTVQPG